MAARPGPALAAASVRSTARLRAVERLRTGAARSWAAPLFPRFSPAFPRCDQNWQGWTGRGSALGQAVIFHGIYTNKIKRLMACRDGTGRALRPVRAIAF